MNPPWRKPFSPNGICTKRRIIVEVAGTQERYYEKYYRANRLRIQAACEEWLGRRDAFWEDIKQFDTKNRDPLLRAPVRCAHLVTDEA